MDAVLDNLALRRKHEWEELSKLTKDLRDSLGKAPSVNELEKLHAGVTKSFAAKHIPEVVLAGQFKAISDKAEPYSQNHDDLIKRASQQNFVEMWMSGMGESEHVRCRCYHQDPDEARASIEIGL